MAQCEGKGINVHSLAECIGSPYETVRGRVNRLIESGLFCRTDNGTIQLCSDDDSIGKWTSASQQVIDNLLTVAAEINKRHRTTEIR
jgi:Mn-dependent DtxR family transcriptional regulator